MSKYTVTLHQLMENNFNFEMTRYPIFDENYRNTLNNKILEHYRFREIGFETPQLFVYYLNRTLNEIMPYYNELYKTTLLEFDPFTNYKMHEEINFSELLKQLTSNNSLQNTLNYIQGLSNDNGFSDTKNDNKNNTDNLSSKNQTNANLDYYIDHNMKDNTQKNEYENEVRKSDTPQGMLSKGFMSDDTWASFVEQDKDKRTVKDDINDRGGGTKQHNDFVDDITHSSSETIEDGKSHTSYDSNSNNENLQNNMSDYTNLSDSDTNKHDETIRDAKGYQGITPMDLIKKLRDNILNIDMMIINELSNLFMLIY